MPCFVEANIVGEQYHPTVTEDGRSDTCQKRKVANDLDSGHMDDEEDLDSQPTMIAYKIDEHEKEVESKQEVESEYEREVELGKQDEGDAASCISKLEQAVGRFTRVGSEDGKTEDQYSHVNNEFEFNQRLETMVSFDPRNKGKLANLSRKDSMDYISSLFKPYREEFRHLDFKMLVSAEVIHFRVNQCIFSKTVLGRSQGYLSDLLNHQDAIMSMEEPTRMFVNFVKIHQFLALEECERRLRYTECVKMSDAEKQRLDVDNQPKISPRRKRMKLPREVKENLVILFRDRDTMPDHEELSAISLKFGLQLPTIKNFFRNFKARSKMSDP